MPSNHGRERETVLKAVSDALNDVATKDEALLSLQAHELALVHRFGVYLEHHLHDELQIDLTIDLDYDRHGRLPKLLAPRPDRGKEGRFRPDLIVHHREDDECNILVVEWKKNARPMTLRRLEERVRSLLAEDPEHYGYAYKLGVLVNSRKDGIKWCVVERDVQDLQWSHIPTPNSATVTLNRRSAVIT